MSVDSLKCTAVWFTFDRAMKESTATAVNMMVGISMTTAEPMLVLKKVMVASQPLPGGTREQLIRGQFKKKKTPNNSHPYHTPQPGMPTVWMMLITTWAMKTKKKAMKLKELSVLQGDKHGRQDGRDEAARRVQLRRRLT